MRVSKAVSIRVHLDVNKTILVDDKIQGINAATSCAQILYWSSWGHVSGKGQRWTWNGETPALLSEDPTAVCYGDFVRKRRISRREKRALKRRFVERGQPGEPLRPYWEEMMGALTLPDDVCASLQGVPWAVESGLARGQVRLLPSFFALQRWLARWPGEATLVLRTYGADLPEVALELNAFCRGEHPLYPGERMDGRGPRRRDARLNTQDPMRFGALHRGGVPGRSDDPQRAVSLALGLLDNPPGRDKPPYPCPYKFFKERAVKMVHSLDDVWAHLERHSGGTLALRDDYAFWARSRFVSAAGKPLRVDRRAGATQDVFFDDNIFEGSAHIIDVRDAETGARVAERDTLGRDIFRVDPRLAVLDADYFTAQLEARFGAPQARRAGGSSEAS